MCLQATVLGCTELWTGFSRGALQRIRLITSLLAETCSSSDPVCCCCASLQLRTFLLFHKHRSVTHEACFSSTTSWNLWCGVIHIVNVESCCWERPLFSSSSSSVCPLFPITFFISLCLLPVQVLYTSIFSLLLPSLLICCISHSFCWQDHTWVCPELAGSSALEMGRGEARSALVACNEHTDIGALEVLRLRFKVFMAVCTASCED